jgi:PAS domain-containing protein
MGPWNPHPPGKTGTDDPTRPRRREGDAQLGVSEISPAGQFLKVNAEICRILGRSADALLQSAVWEVTMLTTWLAPRS